MSLNILTFIIFYFLIINSTLGFGYIINRISTKNSLDYNPGYLGIFGIFGFIFVSYISHFFIPHNYLHNIILVSIGLFGFIFLLSKNSQTKSIVKLNVIFLILFISFIIFKTHDDFAYYHFPYTYYLTQNNIFIGIGNFNHGFRTPSSIFYLNSIFYLPFIKYYFFQIGAVLISGFSSYIFFYIISKNLKNKDYNQYFFLSLFFLIFTLIFFYRIAEHGTDRSAQILTCVFIIELLLLINKKSFEEKFSIILVLLGVIISLKTFYLLYLIFFIPIISLFLKEKKILIANTIFKNLFLYLFLMLVFLIFIVNFLNSGCFVYPISFTCLDFSWSIPKTEVIVMNDWYEQWSKAGAGPNFRVDNPEQYIQKFNWVDNWFNEYFFTKVSDFILGTVFVIIIFISLFRSKNRRNNSFNGLGFIYILILFLFLEWFYNHPSLRYGGYSLIFLIFCLPITNYLSQRYYKDNKKMKLKTYGLMILIIVIFFGRNINRLMNENEKYDYNPFKEVIYKIDENHLRFDYIFEKLINNECKKKEISCDKHMSQTKVKNIFGYNIFYEDRSLQND